LKHRYENYLSIGAGIDMQCERCHGR